MKSFAFITCMLLGTLFVEVNLMASTDPNPLKLESIANWSPGVYWCSRDLDGSPLGNHHFLLFIGSSNMSIFPGYRPKEEEGKYFMTASAGGENGNPTDWGMIKMEINSESDVQAVLEGIDPDEYVSFWKADYDIEAHKITELSTASFPKFSEYLVNYSDNQANRKVEGYDLDDNNCATWVNTLLKAMGISESKREDYGEFDGIDWGEEESFNTIYFTTRIATTKMAFGKSAGTIKDIDGNTYNTVKIGDQTWMAENLKVTRDRHGNNINSLKINAKSSSAGMYWHDNSANSPKSRVYGPLYNYTAIKDNDICPSGWKVPTQDEWMKLLRFWYGKNGVPAGAPGLVFAAKQLRETGGKYWPNNGSATNSTGFAARPGGWIWDGTFHYKDRRLGVWGLNNPGTPSWVKIADGNNGTWSGLASKKDVLYVRCLKK